MPSNPNHKKNGPTLVLTGKAARIAELKDRFARAAIISLPLLETKSKYTPDHPEVMRLLEIVKKTNHLLGAAFSTSGVQALVDINTAHGAGLEKLVWCAVGKRTASMLQKDLQVKRIFCESPDNTGAGLAHSILKQLQQSKIEKNPAQEIHTSQGLENDLLKNEQPRPDAKPEILAISAERGRHEFFEILDAAGMVVHRFALYETNARPPTDRELQAIPQGAWICFGSPSAVDAFFQVAIQAHKQFKFASIGPTTTAALQKQGIPVDHEAKRADYADLMQEILDLP